MASNHGGKDVVDSGSSKGDSSKATVEIKIKTLDSRTHTLRVDKCVPVPALKEQIATVTGVLSAQQRLICRGKVLKDDQLLSAYHVEDGHTLHLVARQPINPSLASVPDHTAPDPASSTGGSPGPSVLVGTFNISEQGDGIPDFSRIVSAVLGSFGIGGAGSSSEPVSMQEHISERLSRIPGLGDVRNSGRQQREDATDGGQRNAQNAAFPLPTDVPMESLPVIPDSLSTLSQYLRHLRQEFNGNVRGQSTNSQGSLGSAGQDSDAASHLATGPGGLPTPAALAEVTESTRQLLTEQAGECLMQLTRQLGDQANVTDPVARTRMQSNALRSGALLQNLGTFLLELGRTTMTLRMGRTPNGAVVNAGPAVFVSTSGPNPIMVQPLPFQPGTSFGTTSLGSGTSFSVGSGFRPRNIDIRIHTGSLLSSAVANQREASSGDRSAGTDPAASDSGTPNPQAAAPSTREPEARVVPIRISTLPPGLAPSESSRSSVGILYPVLARAQHVDSGNLNVARGQTSSGSRPHNDQSGPQPVPDSAVQQGHPEVPGVHGATQTLAGIRHGQSFATEVQSGFNQLLRNLFPGEQNHSNDYTFQGMSENSGSGNVETTQAAVSSQEAPSVTDEGTFLANLLHRIIPLVSQNISGGVNSSVQGAVVEDRSTQPSSSVEESQDRDAVSRQPEDPPSPPTSKRQKVPSKGT